MDKQLLELYGDEYLKAYEKTTQYHIDKLEEQLKKFWDSLGAGPYLEKICKFLSKLTFFFKKRNQ